MVRLDDGSIISYRSSSRSGGPAVDINIPGYAGISKIHFYEGHMVTQAEAIEMLRHAAVIDDTSFRDVVYLWRDTEPPEDATFDNLLEFVGEMLDAGFEPVSSPFATPPSQPWPEKDRQAIFDRMRREWDELTEELNFLHICWFYLPPERHPKGR